MSRPEYLEPGGVLHDMTDQTPERPLAWLAATPYWFVKGHGDGQIARSEDGREIAIYYDGSTGEHWVSSAREWRRMIDEGLDYSQWCAGEGIEASLNEDDILEAETAPDMSDRDRVWAVLENARAEYFCWLYAHTGASTDPDLACERKIRRALDKALSDMRGVRS